MHVSEYENPKRERETFTMIYDDVALCGGLTWPEKFTYCRLVRYYLDHKGYAHVKIRTLAFEADVSERQMRRILKRLNDVGLLDTDSGKGRYESNHYHFPKSGPVLAKLTAEAKKAAESRGDTDVPPEDPDVPIPGGPPTSPLPDTDDPPVGHGCPTLRDKVKKQGLETSQHPSDASRRLASLASAPAPRSLTEDRVACVELESSAPIEIENSADAALSWEERTAKVNGVTGDAAGKAVECVRENLRKSKAKAASNALKGEAAQAQRAENLKGRKPGSGAKKIQALWEQEMLGAYPDYPIVKWGAKEYGQIVRMIEDCGSSLVVEDALCYVVRNWKTVSERYFKSRANPYPSLSFLMKFRAEMAPEAQIWKRHAGTLAEWEVVLRDIADPSEWPQQLQERVREARDELKTIGLG